MTNVKMPRAIGYVIKDPSQADIDIDLPEGTPLITTTQAQAYADELVREAQQWVSVEDRMPEPGVTVIVYSPPQPGDYPDDVRISFDCIDPESDGDHWINHGEHYEHWCCVAKGGEDVDWQGPSMKAPYTHWMHILPPLKQSTPAKLG